MAKLTLGALAVAAGLLFAAACGSSARGPTLLFSRGLPCQEQFRTDLYSIRADGGGLRRLTHTGLDLYGRWSPDGQSIFVLRGNGDCTSAFASDVFEIRADGKAVRQITHSHSDPIDFAAAPDGNHLAFDIDSGLVVTDAAGRHARILARAAPGVEPVWSPDARRILYDSPSGLRVISANGGRPSRVIGRLAENEFHHTAAWSPAGALIVYVGCAPRSCGVSRLRLVHPNGTGQTLLTSGSPGLTDDFPSWSPDGERILFVRTNGDANNNAAPLMVLTLANHQLRTVAKQGGASPAWSPDGSLIAFASHGGISTVRPDGSHLRAVTHDSTDGDPEWQP